MAETYDNESFTIFFHFLSFFALSLTSARSSHNLHYSSLHLIPSISICQPPLPSLCSTLYFSLSSTPSPRAPPLATLHQVAAVGDIQRIKEHGSDLAIRSANTDLYKVSHDFDEAPNRCSAPLAYPIAGLGPQLCLNKKTKPLSR